MRINSQGQSPLEYALLLAVVVAGLVVMQIYLKRGIQGRMRSSSESAGDAQYSPGNTVSNLTTTIVVNTTSGVDGPVSTVSSNETRTRLDSETVTRQ